MPVIAYQSFNANASSNHGLKAFQAQRFTLDANAHVVGEGHHALVVPYSPENVTVPYEGPANRVPIASLTGGQSLEVFSGQVASIGQNLYRQLGAMPDIVVLGEMDASNAAFSSLLTDPDVKIEPVWSKRACQSFTPIVHNNMAKRLTAGEGFVAYNVANLNVVFVHVPNRFATDKAGTAEFYAKIAHHMISGGAVIHLVIGDTNQPSSNFTAEVLNWAFGTSAYVNAGTKGSISPIDNYQVVMGGTNSTGTKMYDVAVYRSDIVLLEAGPAYLSQSSTGVTITDHCGLGLKIKLK